MKKFLFIFLLVLSIHFWGLIFIPHKYNAENLFAWLIMGVCFFLVIKKNGLSFRNAIILLFIGVLINVFSAYINQGQGPKATLLAFDIFYFILFYFFLHMMEYSVKYLEKIIIIFAVLYSVLYIIQVIVSPYPILDIPLYSDRGTIRLRIEGNGFLVLAYLLLLNRFFLKNDYKWLILAFGFFIILLMGGFRTLTFGALLLSMIMFLKLRPFNLGSTLLVAFVITLFVALFQIKGISNILTGMVNSTQDVIASGENYIRFLSFKFFFKEFPINTSVYFLGSGMPGGYSPYYNLVQSYGYNFGFYWSDIGLLGLYIMIGPVAIAGILWYTLKAIFIKLPKDKFYLNMYFTYLLIVSFTTMEIFRDAGIFVVEAIGLYMIDNSLLRLQNSGAIIKQEQHLSI